VVDVVVNNFIIKGTAGMSILNVLRSSGYYVSRFCHNDHLPIAGSCRACLIEITGVEKPVASCVTETEPNLVL
jgi:NADH-quinone oxidoreductase subunit G